MLRTPDMFQPHLTNTGTGKACLALEEEGNGRRSRRSSRIQALQKRLSHAMAIQQFDIRKG